MKINRRKPAATTQDLLITVARSIGSTLGAVAAKVSPWPRASHTGGRRVASAALSTISHPKATDAPLQGHRRERPSRRFQTKESGQSAM
jgi:hypothetical protein